MTKRPLWHVFSKQLFQLCKFLEKAGKPCKLTDVLEELINMGVCLKKNEGELMCDMVDYTRLQFKFTDYGAFAFC